MKITDATTTGLWHITTIVSGWALLILFWVFVPLIIIVLIWIISEIIKEYK